MELGKFYAEKMSGGFPFDTFFWIAAKTPTSPPHCGPCNCKSDPKFTSCLAIDDGHVRVKLG